MANGVTKANTQSVNQRKRDEEEARRQSEARKRQEEEMKRQQAEMKRQQEEAARQQEAERKRQAESSRKNSERRNQTSSKVTPDASIPVLDPKYASPEAIERGREFGRKALADVKAGRVTSNDPLGYARGLPGMSEVYKAQAAAEEAQAQAEAEARQQAEAYRDRLLAENASRNAQRHGQLSAQSTTMPMEQNMSGQMPTQDVQTIANGPANVLGTRRDRSMLSESGQKEVDRLSRKIESLQRTPMTGDAAIDEATQTNNQSQIADLQRQIDSIYETDNSERDANIDRYLDPQRKLSKYEKEDANAIFEEYINSNPKAKELYNTNDAAMSSLLAQRFTPEEAEEYARMITLKNKISRGQSAGLHAAESMPFVKGLADKSTEKYGERVGKNLSDYNYSSQLEQTMTQNPLASTGGNMAYQLGSYAAFSPLVEGIPVVGKAAEAAGKLFKNPAVGSAVSNIIKGQAADTILDTLPNEIIPDIMEGNWKDLPKDIGLNQLANLGFNVLGEAGGALARNFIPSLRNADEVADAVKQELDPVELAKQNEIDVDSLEKEYQEILQQLRNNQLALPMRDLDAREQAIIEQFNKYHDKDFPSNEVFNMGETERYLSDFGNVDNNTYLKQSKYKQLTAPFDKRKHQHGLTDAEVAGYVRDANSPIAVFGSQENTPVIVGNRFDDAGNPIVSSIKMDEPVGRDTGNYLASEYRKNVGDQLYYARKEGRMKFENREKVDRLISDRRHHSPESDSSLDLLSNSSVNPIDDSVKDQYGWSDSANRIIPQDSYARTDEFRELQRQRGDLSKQMRDLHDQNAELREALKSETSVKPKEEWTQKDEIDALLGKKPETLTPKGQEIKAQIDANDQALRDLEARHNSIDDDMHYRMANERLAQLEKYEASNIMPASQPEYAGFSTKPGHGYKDYIDNGEAILAEMSPEEYIQRCAYQIFGQKGYETLESTLNGRGQKKVAELIEEIRKGTKLDAPYLDYTTRGQEGLHRALAAYELGIEKIPVAVRGTPLDNDFLGNEARHLIHDVNMSRLDAKLNEMDEILDPDELLEIEREINDSVPAVEEAIDQAAKQADEVPTVAAGNITSSDVIPPSGGDVIPNVDATAPTGDKISQYATNTMKRGTNLTPEEYAQQDLSQFMYESKTEKQSMEDAFRMIEEEGADNLKARLMSEDAKDFTQSEVDALLSLIRTNNATIRALKFDGKLDEAAALRAETTAMNKKVRQQSTSNAQALQALAKWTRNTPEGMLMQAENIVNGNAKTNKSPLQEALDKLKRNKKNVDFSPEFEDEFLAAAEKLQAIGDMDSREAKDIMAKLGRLVNDQIPVKLNEKVQAYLMDNMLGNFRTLITRNAGGNLGLNAMEQTLTRPLAAGIDRLVAKKTGVRTQAGMSVPALKEYIQGFAKGISDEAHDLKTGLHTARTGENTLEESIRANRHVFKNKVMDKLDSLVKNGLSVGDRPFYEATYKQTLGDYNRLRKAGVMGDDIQNLPDEMFDEYAKTAANLNALAAVYQNNSQLSQALLKMKDGIGDLSEGMLGFDILSQFSMPFVKTPANVVDRAIDYTPLGIIRNAVRTTKEGGIGGENFDQNRFVNETARNVLGTTLMGAGVGAAANGIMSGAYSDDADEKRIQKESGMQEYALNLPGDMQMDISWIPVLGSNLVAADAAYNAYKNDGGESKGLALTKGLAEGGQSLFDQSMFQGLQRLFGAGETYNNDEKIVSNMLNVVKQGFGQAIPSLVRQTAQVSDKYQRDLGGSNKDTSFGPFDNYTLNSWANNIPGLREALLNPKVDSQGNLIRESQGRNLASRILEDMILPGKITQLTNNALNDEANRLSDITGNKTSYLPKANRNKVDTEDHILTNQEYLEYQQRHNGELNRAGEALMNTEMYNMADDQTKESMLSNVYSAVSTAINSEYNGKELTGAAKAYAEGGMDAVIDYVQYGGILKQYGLDNNEKNRNMVKEGGIEAVEQASQAKEFMDEAGVTSNSKFGEMIQNDIASGNIEHAQSVVDSKTTLQSLGLNKSGPTFTYEKAQTVFPNLSIEEFAQTYKAIDADGNQGIKQGEIIDYLNSGSYTQAQGNKIWSGYGNSTWKKIPVLDNNGTWSLKSK